MRLSPGSPSQSSATLSPRAARCRSRQLAETFSSPPSNQRAQGRFQSSTLSHGLVQVSSALAVSSQNASRSSIERRYILLVGRRVLDESARLVKLAGGANRRPSRETDLMTPEASLFELSSLAIALLRDVSVSRIRPEIRAAPKMRGSVRSLERRRPPRARRAAPCRARRRGRRRPPDRRSPRSPRSRRGGSGPSPPTPSRRASYAAAARKPTPWTRPRTTARTRFRAGS